MYLRVLRVPCACCVPCASYAQSNRNFTLQNFEYRNWKFLSFRNKNPFFTRSITIKSNKIKMHAWKGYEERRRREEWRLIFCLLLRIRRSFRAVKEKKSWLVIGCTAEYIPLVLATGNYPTTCNSVSTWHRTVMILWGMFSSFASFSFILLYNIIPFFALLYYMHLFICNYVCLHTTSSLHLSCIYFLPFHCRQTQPATFLFICTMSLTYLHIASFALVIYRDPTAKRGHRLVIHLQRAQSDWIIWHHSVLLRYVKDLSLFSFCFTSF